MSASEPRLFSVISWGASGSQWLVRLLNAHPDVLCLHHLRGHWAFILDEPPVANLTYLRVVERQGRAYRLAGDVHGVDPHDLDAARREFGSRLRVACMSRHPVPRIASQLGVLHQRGFASYGLSPRRLRHSLPRGLRAAFDDEEKLFFVHVMGLVNRIRLETQLGPVFTLERLSGEVEAVHELLDHLSAGELTFPEEVLERLWARPLNPHASPDQPRDPKDAFARWPSWQREAFATLLEPEARALYESLGFDLSFVS